MTARSLHESHPSGPTAAQTVVPFPPGALQDAGHVRARHAGELVPSQAEPMTWHEDGSIATAECLASVPYSIDEHVQVDWAVEPGTPPNSQARPKYTPAVRELLSTPGQLMFHVEERGAGAHFALLHVLGGDSWYRRGGAATTSRMYRDVAGADHHLAGNLLAFVTARDGCDVVEVEMLWFHGEAGSPRPSIVADKVGLVVPPGWAATPVGGAWNFGPPEHHGDVATFLPLCRQLPAWMPFRGAASFRFALHPVSEAEGGRHVAERRHWAVVEPGREFSWDTTECYLALGATAPDMAHLGDGLDWHAGRSAWEHPSLDLRGAWTDNKPYSNYQHGWLGVFGPPPRAKYGGVTGGGGIEQVPGILVAAGGEHHAVRLAHECLADGMWGVQQGGILVNRDGEHLDADEVPPGKWWFVNSAFHPQHPDPYIAAPIFDPWLSILVPQVVEPPTDEAKHHSTFDPMDAQHAQRLAGEDQLAAQLWNDPLARWRLRAMACHWMLMSKSAGYEGMVGGEAHHHPGKTAPAGRETAWGHFGVAQHASFVHPDQRGKWADWMDSWSALLELAQNDEWGLWYSTKVPGAKIGFPDPAKPYESLYRMTLGPMHVYGLLAYVAQARTSGAFGNAAKREVMRKVATGLLEYAWRESTQGISFSFAVGHNDAARTMFEPSTETPRTAPAYNWTQGTLWSLLLLLGEDRPPHLFESHGVAPGDWSALAQAMLPKAASYADSRGWLLALVQAKAAAAGGGA
jgi:hypothetical protein